MRLYKREGSTYWQVEFPGGIRYSTRCKTKRAAEAWARQRELELADPSLAAQKTTSLRDALGDWIADREAAGRAAATLKFYAGNCGALLRIIGEVKLCDVTHEAVQRFIKQRECEASRKTVKMELTALRAALRLAKARGCYSLDPYNVVPRGYSAEYVPRKRFLTWCQAGQLLERLSEHRRAHVGFILATGARLGESLRAQPEDIDLVAGTVFLRGKKTKRAARTVPVLPHTRWMLELALNQTCFRPWSNTNANRDLSVACKRAGIQRVSPNDLRRTSAQWLRELGCDVTLIAEFLGHSSTAMVTRVYGRLEGTRLGDAIRRSTID